LSYFVAEFPNSASGRVNLGSAYLAKVRETAGAPMGLAEVLPILPEPGVVIRGFYSQSDLEDARDHFRKAIDAEPEDVTALAGLAMVEMRIGDLQRARQHVDEALRVEPDDGDLLLCSGNVYYLDRRYREAVSQYVAALSVRPGWPPAKKNLALTYESLERTDEALSLWRELVGDERYGPEAAQRVRDLAAGRD
jgi:tetratricopeptide (TPR) repeat protein